MSDGFVVCIIRVYIISVWHSAGHLVRATWVLGLIIESLVE